MGNSDKQAGNGIMPLMKGFPSKHRVKEEKGAIKNSGMYLISIDQKNIGIQKNRAFNLAWYGGDTFIVQICILRRPQNFAKSSPYI